MKKVITNLIPSVTLEFTKRTFLKLLFLSGIIFLAEKSNSQNLLVDSSFEPSITPYYTDPPPLNTWLSWANYYGTGASFTTDVQNDVCSYFIDNPGTNMYDIQLTQYGFPLKLNHRYRLSFDVKADAERDFGVFIGEFQGSWWNFNPSYTRHATSSWETITIDFDATAVFPLHKLSFEMGIQKINMSFANVSLMDLGLIVDDKVVIAGTFQKALGCANDWDPNCDATSLVFDSSTGLWSGTFNIPAGCHQYKTTIDGSWDTNYGENGIKYGANMSLYVAKETMVTFTYDPSTHVVQTSPIASGFSSSCLPQVVLVGTFQNELGCSNEWDPSCTNTALSYVPATGLFEGDFYIPAGNYAYRVILNNDWLGNNFGVDGIPNGDNYTMSICDGVTKVHFTYDPITHVVKNNLNTQPSTVVIAGSFQSEVGCTGDWQPDCDNTRMHYDPQSGTWIDTLQLPAGHWEYKITLNNSWEENYGLYGIPNGENIPLDLCYPAKVVFHFYDLNCAHFAYTDIIVDQPSTVVIAGSFQSEVGCSGDWQPDCDNSRMHYDAPSGAWVTTLNIPAGHWEYKITLNNSWEENYGQFGVRNGDNIPLDLCSPSKVVFRYYHDNCYNYVYADVFADEPNTVVIAGSFQSELGCGSDWQADCNNTRMTYDAAGVKWVDTLLIPAGHWEYKWATNNSWDENYGLYGQLNGPAISLDLCYPAKVVFNFYHYSCYGYGYAYIITNGVCVNKFYDANLNGYPDYAEEPMGGVQFTLSGNGITQTQTTGSDGKTAFSNLPDGFYVIKENVPSGYYSSGVDSQFVYLFGNSAMANFGNVCIGPGGAKGIGFWATKNGEAALKNSGRMEEALWGLRSWSLRNADGSDFDPYTYQQLTTWLKGANAKNMTYMLSAQLAAMFLNIEMGYVTYDRYVYTPGCSYWGNFMNVYSLIFYTNYYLSYKTTADGKDPDRGYLECLKNAFDNANNNLTFVQPHPCTGTVTKTEKNTVPEESAISRTAKVWPNPSANYFTLRPANAGNHETVQLKVYNITGQEVYTAHGFSDKDYRFGERFTRGVYMVELIQGNERSTFKLVKQ